MGFYCPDDESGSNKQEKNDAMEAENMRVGPKKGRQRKKQARANILKQMEFYFSDTNLMKNRTVGQALSQYGYIDMETILGFNRIKLLTQSPVEIIKALEKSELVEVYHDGQRLRRKTPIIKKNTDNCTIYVQTIRVDTTREWIENIFSDFGKINYVSLPKYNHNGRNKGFAFIEYDNEDSASKAVAFFNKIGYKLPSEPSEQIVSLQQTQDKIEYQIREEIEKKHGKKKRNLFIKMRTRNAKPITLCESIITGEIDKKTLPDQVTLPPEASTSNQLNGDISTVNTKLVEVVPLNENIPTNNDIQDFSDQKTEGCIVKKEKKKKKGEKKRIEYFKELGLQILPLLEWKNLRNRYMSVQKRRMMSVKRLVLGKNKATEDGKPQGNETITSKDQSQILKSDQESLPKQPRPRKKERGFDKLRRKAEKAKVNHIRFD